ncbi:hypothetical protein IMZ11_27690 [Microtetraspora sp. AC03309]|uniref:hypothetical protein n=1 Tax=Microtetraspora sp. AC03309 TaxID=2779376 RepID=UPI001E3B56E4|nr:hypothetical protein [Microtetraspora sp. AC03309]MCC5579420.1 hypothetical protein [Microtetraspora sp. AC03309]
MRTEQENRQSARRVPARGRTAANAAGRAQNGRDGRQIRGGEAVDPPASGTRRPASAARAVPPADPPVRPGGRGATATDAAKATGGARGASAAKSAGASKGDGASRGAAASKSAGASKNASASRSASAAKGRSAAKGAAAQPASARTSARASAPTARASAPTASASARASARPTASPSARPAAPPSGRAPRATTTTEAPAAGTVPADAELSTTVTAEPVVVRGRRRPVRRGAVPKTAAAAARGGRRPPRAPFVLLVVGLLCGGLVSLLLLNTVLAQDSFELSDLRSGTERLRQQADQLDNQVRTLTQPNALDEQARGGSGVGPNGSSPNFVRTDPEPGARISSEGERQAEGTAR